jgi:hypothetical protein
VSGAIEVRANLAQNSLSLTFSGRAQFDVTLTTNPDDFATVPLTYDWVGIRGPCRWGGSGSDGELRVRLIAIRSGRPLVELSGATAYPSEPCNNEYTSRVSFQFYTGDHDGGSAIAPQVFWSTADGSLDGRGTGTLSVQCAGCGSPPGATFKLKAIWGRRIDFRPKEPRAGRPVRVTQNVLLLEKSSTDTAWALVKSPKVTVRCDVYYSRSSRDVRKSTVRGRWRTPGQTGVDGEMTCGPWRVPKSARGSWLGVTPRLTYRGKTVLSMRGGRGFLRVLVTG